MPWIAMGRVKPSLARPVRRGRHMPHLGRALPWISLLGLTVMPGCGGQAVAQHLERINDDRFVEYVGANHYSYSITRLESAPERGSARLALAPPMGARELGQIEVIIPYDVGNLSGLRARRAEFFPTIATLAGRLGGTRFVVVHSDRPSWAPWITGLVVDVYDVR
jgi:hypothetical protein